MARTGIKFYTDEQVAGAVAKGLRVRGFDVRTVPEAGLLGAGDIIRGLVLIHQALDADDMRGHVEYL